MIAPGPCPHCGALLDAETKIAEQRSDDPGEVIDVGVCIYCARLAILDFEAGARRRPTETETDEILRQPMVRRLLRVVRKVGPRDPGRRHPR